MGGLGITILVLLVAVLSFIIGAMVMQNAHYLIYIMDNNLKYNTVSVAMYKSHIKEKQAQIRVYLKELKEAL